MAASESLTVKPMLKQRGQGSRHMDTQGERCEKFSQPKKTDNASYKSDPSVHRFKHLNYNNNFSLQIANK